MNRLGWIGGVFGLLFATSTLVPLGIYHFEGEANIVGMLWNIMLPTGWFDLALGVMIFFHRKIGFSTERVPYLLLLGGLLSIILFYFQDIDLFLGLWHGVRGDFDVDGKWVGTLTPFYSGLTSTVVGLVGVLRNGFLSNQQGTSVNPGGRQNG